MESWEWELSLLLPWCACLGASEEEWGKHLTCCASHHKLGPWARPRA